MQPCNLRFITLNVIMQIMWGLFFVLKQMESLMLLKNYTTVFKVAFVLFHFYVILWLL